MSRIVIEIDPEKKAEFTQAVRVLTNKTQKQVITENVDQWIAKYNDYKKKGNK